MWELVGLCSFALIGHWWEEKPNSDAALKAFLVNRVGDVGLICGVIILYFGAGTFDIRTINEMAISGEISPRSEELTSELQSLMRTSYAVFCLNKKKQTNKKNT